MATVRQWARELLTGTASDTTVDDLVLLLSEVVTNAVVHSDSGRAPGGSVMVCLGFGGGFVHVEVIDDGSATSVPFVRAADADSDGGRGLLLVDLIATGWGACRDTTGNIVWFRLPVTAPGPCLPR